MPAFEFCKFHGFGNDYIVIEESRLPEGTDIASLARKMCDRHRGAGSDGLALLSSPEGGSGDFHCRIINPDGSEAGFSGNGTRCAAAYLYYRNLWSGDSLDLSTPSGLKKFELLERNERGFIFRSQLGKPGFKASEIPFSKEGVGEDEEVIARKITIGVREYEINCLNAGNPVCVIFVDGFSFNWRRVGRLLEKHAFFPERTNVVFVKVNSREEVDIRIWERGAGETSSSGTCSIAAAVAAAHTGRTQREIDVKAPGGVTRTNWRDDGEMIIEGTAELAYCGVWEAIKRDEGE